MKSAAAIVLALAFGTASAFAPSARVASRGQVQMDATPCGINGFGRIGRLVARIMVKNPETDLKLINSGAAAEYMAYQFKYDTIHGKYDGVVEVDGDSLVIDGVTIPLSHTRDPSEIPFAKYGATYVCESTGAFLTDEKIQPHIAAGAQKVIFSAPAKDDSKVIVMGVNQDEYETSMNAVSCASCTTNGLAPMVKAINDAYGIEEALMTTVHAMTATQKVVDASSNKDWRGEGRDEGDPVAQGQAHRHGVPRADGRRLGRRPHGRAEQGDDVRGHLRRDQGGGQRPDEGLHRLLRRAARLDRLRVGADLVGLRRGRGHHAQPQVRQGRRLVRQRVGLLEPRRRPHALHGQGRRGRQGLGLNALYALFSARPLRAASACCSPVEEARPAPPAGRRDTYKNAGLTDPGRRGGRLRRHRLAF